MRKILSRLSNGDRFTIIGFITICLFVALFFIKQNTYLEVEILVTHDNLLYSDPMPPFWYQEKITTGAEEKDGVGRVIAKIISLKTYEEKENKRDTYVRAKIATSYNSRNGDYSFRGQSIKIGSPITISPGNIIIKGIITSTSNLEDNKEEIIVKSRVSGWNDPDLTANGIDPIYLNAVEVGDSVKDLSGDAIAMVVDKQVYPGKRITYDSLGNTRLVQDPYFKEGYLTLKLKVRKSGSTYYYMDKYKVKTNERLPLYFDNTTQHVEVIEILHDKAD